jgi:hypothetical protein
VLEATAHRDADWEAFPSVLAHSPHDRFLGPGELRHLLVLERDRRDDLIFGRPRAISFWIRSLVHEDLPHAIECRGSASGRQGWAVTWDEDIGVEALTASSARIETP